MNSKDFEEIQMNLEVLAGLVADLDEPDAHIINVSGEILQKLARAPGFGDALLEPLQMAMAAFKKIQDSGDFDSTYRELCDAVDQVQKAAAQTIAQEQAPDSDDSQPEDEPIPAAPAAEEFMEPLEPMEPGDLQEFELNLDIISDLLADPDPDNLHILGVIADMFEKISGTKNLHKDAMALTASAAAAARAAQAGEQNFDKSLPFLRQSVADLQKTMDLAAAEKAPAQAPGDDAPSPEVSGGELLDTDLQTFLEHQNSLLQDLETNILAMEGGEAGARQEIIQFFDSLGKQARQLKLRGVRRAMQELNKLLQNLGDGSDGNVVNALLGVKDMLNDFFTARLEGDTESEFDAARVGVLTAPLGQGETAAAAPEKPAALRKPPEVNIDVNNPELRDFITESREYLQSAETALLELEKDPSNKEQLNEIFRCFHNVKGISGFLNLADVNELSHTAESLMDDAREGKISFAGPVAQAAFEALDLLRAMVERVDAALAGQAYATPDDYGVVMNMLENPDAAAAAAAVAPQPEQAQPDTPAPAAQEAPAAAKIKASTNGMIKVNTGRLDNLIDAVGELVIANSMVIQEPEIRDTTNPRLSRNVSLLTKITRELQEMAMSMRMVSLKTTFQKMARVVRDLSVKSGRPVDFSFTGEDTELDRTVVDEIGSPLVHMVRNAMDHGIEPPDERRKRGKPERGRVKLNAYHEGGNVIITVQDDGRGLDREAILAKAERLGLASAEAELTDREIHHLIFAPGFSTAAQVTDVSGRGVGMDVVKRNIQNLRGRVEIETEPGQGTTFIIRLPLTLAIIDGMVVTVAGERYIIPTIAIIESLRPTPEQLKTVVKRGEMLNLRGELLPLFRLYRLFQLEGAKEDPGEALVVVIAGDGSQCAVLVDELVGQQQVVIKSLGKTFDNLDGVSGGAIMGDGRVALILDTSGLVRAAHNYG